MNGLIYWTSVIGVAVVGTAVIWFFSHLWKARNESGRTGLAFRIFRAGALALFLTPSVAGWFPCPYILALLWAIFVMGTADILGTMNYILWISKWFVVAWVIIFFVAENWERRKA